jgi:hypothetical protein
MTDGQQKELAQIMRDLTIRLLFETDPEKQEALVVLLARLVDVQRGPSRVA